MLNSQQPPRTRSRGKQTGFLLGAIALTGTVALTLGGCSSGSTDSADSDGVVIEAVPSLPTSYAYDLGDFTYAGFEFQINTNAQLDRKSVV